MRTSDDITKNNLLPPNQATTCWVWHPADSAGHHLRDISGFLYISGIFIDFLEFLLAEISSKIPWFKLSHQYLFTYIQPKVENMQSFLVRMRNCQKKQPGVKILPCEQPHSFTWCARAILELYHCFWTIHPRAVVDVLIIWNQNWNLDLDSVLVSK